MPTCAAAGSTAGPLSTLRRRCRRHHRPAGAAQRDRRRRPPRRSTTRSATSWPTTAPGCSSSPAPARTAFCAGADLKALDTLGPRLDLPEGPLGFTRLASPKPTIAAIAGWCLAGGFELALWCDLRVATPSARFGFTERRFGVPLIDGGTQRLPRIVGSGRALDLVLSGRVIDVEEAERFGLVTERVPAGGHVERALAMAEAIAAFPQDTLLSDRRAVLEGAGLPLVQGLALEAQLGRGRHETAVRARHASRAARAAARRCRDLAQLRTSRGYSGSRDPQTGPPHPAKLVASASRPPPPTPAPTRPRSAATYGNHSWDGVARHRHRPRRVLRGQRSEGNRAASGARVPLGGTGTHHVSGPRAG